MLIDITLSCFRRADVSFHADAYAAAAADVAARPRMHSDFRRLRRALITPLISFRRRCF